MYTIFKIIKKKKLALFYVLSVYILTIFLWWWVLLFTINDKYYYAKKNSLSDAGKSIPTILMEEHRRQQLMIIGEGSTFIFLLLIGIFFIRKNLKKELAIAQQQQNFMLSITHELKSPLAAAQLNIQTLIKRTLTDEQRNLLLGNSLQDLDRLKKMVENILLAAKIEQPDFSIYKSEFDISQMVEMACNDARKYWNTHVFVSQVQKNVQLYGDEWMLRNALMNLLENAVKYSYEGSSIDIILSSKNNYAKLSVSDKGKMIPESESTKIFDKFYRIGDESVRTEKGVGLGLYLVKKVVHSHKGQIILEQSDNKKQFVISLPLSHV
jgi:K+-sensing histidine kinase KdpD